jgi:hypothetical protein
MIADASIYYSRLGTTTCVTSTASTAVEGFDVAACRDPAVMPGLEIPEVVLLDDSFRYFPSGKDCRLVMVGRLSQPRLVGMFASDRIYPNFGHRAIPN